MEEWTVVQSYEHGHTWRHDFLPSQYHQSPEVRAKSHVRAFEPFVTTDYVGPTSRMPEEYRKLKPILDTRR